MRRPGAEQPSMYLSSPEMISCVSSEMYTARSEADPGFYKGIRFEDNMEREPIMGVWGFASNSG